MEKQQGLLQEHKQHNKLSINMISNEKNTLPAEVRRKYQQPSNNRLDIGATLESRKHKKYHSSWTFSVYNVYGSLRSLYHNFSRQ